MSFDLQGFRKSLEGMDFDEETVEKMVAHVQSMIVEEEEPRSVYGEALETAILQEDDWRQRASLIARKISLGLDT